VRSLNQSVSLPLLSPSLPQPAAAPLIHTDALELVAASVIPSLPLPPLPLHRPPLNPFQVSNICACLLRAPRPPAAASLRRTLFGTLQVLFFRATGDTESCPSCFDVADNVHFACSGSRRYTRFHVGNVTMHHCTRSNRYIAHCLIIAHTVACWASDRGLLLQTLLLKLSTICVAGGT
jgi:hypothetical protein